MTIDLDTAEGRKQYLSDKLDDLLDGINESYGTVLMEELLNRLELTIRDFNEEMKTLCDQLVKKQEERQQLLEMIKSNQSIPAEIESNKASPVDIDSQIDIKSTEKSESDIPAWEQKLAKLEKK